MVAGSNPATPTRVQLQKTTALLTKSQIQFQSGLLTKFLKSRREGLSPRTIEFYQGCLTPFVRRYEITSEGISAFLSNLTCGNGKLNHYRAITVFVHYLIREGYLTYNPLTRVDKPKAAKKILPSVDSQQLQVLLSNTDSPRDRTIISLLHDSGMRLSEITSIKPSDIDWEAQTITIIGKGNKQRRAPFTKRTGELLRNYLAEKHEVNGNIWDIQRWGIQSMLKRLEAKTDIDCNPHSFRRGFACNLHRKGLSTLDIMHLGGWDDLDMVLKYTRSITFDDCLKHYKAIAGS